MLAKTSCLWRGRQASRAQAAFSTGHRALDRRLPGGGWPRGAVTELIAARSGLGEFSLLFPALAAAGREGRWMLLIDPPWIPYPAALHGHGLCLERLLWVQTASRDESLWACEQALGAVSGALVLSWPDQIRFAALRRLQLVAGQRGATAFLFRPHDAAAQASPAALRLKLSGTAEGTRIDILKCRGRVPAEPIVLRTAQHERRGTHELERNTQRIFTPAPLARDPLAAPGAGLPHPRAARPDDGRRHH